MSKEREFVVSTGKGGAIEMHLTLTRKLMTLIGSSEEDIEETLRLDKIRMERDWVDGCYTIDTRSEKDFITEPLTCTSKLT